MKTPLYIYDKLETDFSTMGEAVILTANDPIVNKRLNLQPILTFDIAKEDEKYNLIQNENIIKAEGQLYIIRDITETKDINGAVIASVYAEHVLSELLDGWVAGINLSNTTAQQVLDSVLLNTRFTGNATQLTALNDYFIEKANSSKALNELLKIWSAEIEIDNFNITLKDQIGNNNGVQFRYQKNLKGIKRKTDSKGLITRLHVYGKGDLSLVIDSPNINVYPTIKNASVTFSEVDNLVDLQALGEEYLAKHDKAIISYETDVVELKKLVEYGETETFDLGDTIRIIDEDFGELAVRIVGYTYSLDEPDKTRVILANFIPNLADTMAGLQESKQVIDQITYRGKLNTYWLDGEIDAIKNQIKASGSYATAEVRENEGMIFENNDETSVDYGAVYIGTNIVALADEKINGVWNWRTAIKGSGIIADEIKTGILKASLVKIMADNATYLDGSGIHVQDSNLVERVRIGEYEAGKYGIKTTRADSKVRVIQDSASGFLIQKNIGTEAAPTWVDVFYTDSNGNAIYSGSITANQITSQGDITAGALQAKDSSGTTRIGMGGANYGYYEMRLFDSNGFHVGTISGTTGQLNIASPQNVVIGGDIYFSSGFVDFQNAEIRNFGANIIAKFG